MVKLFLVCLAVCMGATSGQVKLGTCSGSGKVDLSKYSNQKLKGCGMTEESYKELKATPTGLRLEFGTYDAVSMSITATLKFPGSNILDRKVTFTNKDGYTVVTGLEGLVTPSPGNLINRDCANKNVFSTICNKNGAAGSRLDVHWANENENCDNKCYTGPSDKWHRFG